MSGLEVRLDASALAELASRFAAMPHKMRPAIRMAVNDAGDRATPPMKRELVKQTGLKAGTIRRALNTLRATDASLTFTFDTRGGDIRLKYFGARETAAGVSAAPRGQRQTFAHTFMRAGWWPNRVTKPNWNGQVFRRTGGTTKNGKPQFEVVRSGVFIPAEMVTGATASSFETVSSTVLPVRLAHHIGRALA